MTKKGTITTIPIHLSIALLLIRGLYQLMFGKQKQNQDIFQYILALRNDPIFSTPKRFYVFKLIGATWKSKTWVTNYELRVQIQWVTSSNPRVTSSNLRVTSSNTWVITLEAQVAGLKPQVGRIKHE